MLSLLAVCGNNGETSFLARRPCAGAVPGRWGACLAVRTPPAAFLTVRRLLAHFRSDFSHSVASQIFTSPLVRYPPDEARRLPSALKATLMTDPACPCRTASSLPVAASQTRTV